MFGSCIDQSLMQQFTLDVVSSPAINSEGITIRGVLPGPEFKLKSPAIESNPLLKKPPGSEHKLFQILRIFLPCVLLQVLDPVIFYADSIREPLRLFFFGNLIF